MHAHHGFFMLKNCFSLPKMLYFWRIRTCFNHPALLEEYGETVRDGLSKVGNVIFDDISSTQLAISIRYKQMVQTQCNAHFVRISMRSVKHLQSRSTVNVTSMGFPPFVADQGGVSSPTNCCSLSPP